MKYRDRQSEVLRRSQSHLGKLRFARLNMDATILLSFLAMLLLPVMGHQEVE